MNEEKLDPKFVQKPIRTYESDLAEMMAKKQASAASIAIAENKKKVEAQKSELDAAGAQTTPGKLIAQRILLGLMSLILLGGGAVGGYILYKKSAFAKPTPQQMPIVIPSLIPSDKQVPVAVADLSSTQLTSQIHAALAKETLPSRHILELKTGLSASAFIEKSGMSMPDIILRSLTDRWMLGAYSEDTGEKTIFLALSTDFFQNVFAGMLAWEDTMANDLSLLFGFEERPQGEFIDRVLRNRDVREFRTQNGQLLFLYSFINKETLLITTTESAFIAAIDRIEKQTVVR